MIQHVVVATWKEKTTEADVAELCALLADIPAQVPAVRAYRFGPDLGISEGTADFAVLAEVEDADALAAYLEHPVHLVVREKINDMAGPRVRVQFALAESDPEPGLRELYAEIIRAWNGRDAEAFAACFAADGVTVGFDGSELAGAEAIATELGRIFADHPTPPYVTEVETVRSAGPHVAVLRAVAGMAPPGKDELERSLNTRQTLVAERHGVQWRAVLFQNTPARMDGRPEEVDRMTQRLRAAR